MGCTPVGLDALAPLGAASSGQSTSIYGHGVPLPVFEWPGVASGSGDVGGDPRTDHFVPETGGDPKTDHFVPETGGDPKTDHFVQGTGGDPKTDHFVQDTGGDPKTDHASFSAQMVGVVDEMAATCPPYRPGAVAPQTANPSAAAPTAVLDFSVGGGHPDEFSIVHAERPDGFPSTVAACDEHLDGLPSSADSKGRTNLDSTLDDKSTAFTRILQLRKSLNDSASRIQKFKSCPPVAAHPS